MIKFTFRTSNQYCNRSPSAPLGAPAASLRASLANLLRHCPPISSYRFTICWQLYFVTQSFWSNNHLLQSFWSSKPFIDFCVAMATLGSSRKDLINFNALNIHCDHKIDQSFHNRKPHPHSVYSATKERQAKAVSESIWNQQLLAVAASREAKQKASTQQSKSHDHDEIPEVDSVPMESPLSG